MAEGIRCSSRASARRRNRDRQQDHETPTIITARTPMPGVDPEPPLIDDRFRATKNCELSQKRALAPVRHRRINSLRHNDAGPLTCSFTALYGNVYFPTYEMSIAEFQRACVSPSRTILPSCLRVVTQQMWTLSPIAPMFSRVLYETTSTASDITAEPGITMKRHQWQKKQRQSSRRPKAAARDSRLPRPYGAAHTRASVSANHRA